MTWLLTLWRYRKAVLASALVALAAAGVLLYGRAQHQRGRAEVQAQWAQAEARAAQAVLQSRMEYEAALREAKRINEEAKAGYETELARIAADRDSLADRLRNSAVCANRVSAASDRPGPAAAPAESSSTPRVDGALDRYDAACRRDAAQLDALIRQVKGQLD